VARVYAGFLGPLAFLTSLTRGMIHGGSAESVLLGAWCCLLVFAAVGYAVGRIAERTVEEAVLARVAAEMAARRSAAKGP
jgi:hypothetical protein